MKVAYFYNVHGRVFVNKFILYQTEQKTPLPLISTKESKLSKYVFSVIFELFFEGIVLLKVIVTLNSLLSETVLLMYFFIDTTDCSVSKKLKNASRFSY